MKYILLTICFACACSSAAQAQSAGAATWDLAQAYDASTHVFFGELSKSIPEPDFKTGVMGVHIKEIDEKTLRLELIVWPKAKELTFAVEDSFKQATPDSFAVFLADPHPDIWTHVVSAAGDVFLAKPQEPDPLLTKLQPGDRGLFFVRTYLGSNIPVLYRVRLGQDAQEDLALLRAQRAAGNVPMTVIVAQARARAEELARKEAAEFKAFEDEYYKILRIQDLDIRTSLLNDLITRMGFEGRWSYFDFKERYLKAHGAHTSDSEVPPGPAPESKEKLWQDISGELKKIDVIQKARGDN